MVALPLFKLATLFVRHISKYGANRIKIQAHDHPGFRRIAARYGQTMHQINMRVSVAVLRDVAAERRAKEREEAPTVKTEEQAKAEEAAKEKAAAKGKTSTKDTRTSIWRRKFRPLPEAKAVDLFADVIGDTFILSIAVALLLWETLRSKKPDSNSEKITEMQALFEADEKRIAELEEAERQQQKRVTMVEQALEDLREASQNKKKPTST